MSNDVAARCVGVALASVGFLAGIGVFSAAAQPLPKAECRLANAVISELFTKYSGKLSEQFVASVKSFVAKDCDMGTDFKMVEGTQDAAAFGELRVRLIAYRMRR
jgi:hypothetical protein